MSFRRTLLLSVDRACYRLHEAQFPELHVEQLLPPPE